MTSQATQSGATQSANVEIYSSAACPFCIWALQLLESQGIQYTEYSVDRDAKLRQEAMDRSGRRTVPQIFINGAPIGGFDELEMLHQNGRLDALIAPSDPA